MVVETTDRRHAPAPDGEPVFDEVVGVSHVSHPHDRRRHPVVDEELADQFPGQRTLVDMDSVHQDDLAFPNVPGLLVDAPVAFRVSINISDNSNLIHSHIHRGNAFQNSTLSQTIGNLGCGNTVAF